MRPPHHIPSRASVQLRRGNEFRTLRRINKRSALLFLIYSIIGTWHILNVVPSGLSFRERPLWRGCPPILMGFAPVSYLASLLGTGGGSFSVWSRPSLRRPPHPAAPRPGILLWPFGARDCPTRGRSSSCVWPATSPAIQSPVLPFHHLERRRWPGHQICDGLGGDPHAAGREFGQPVQHAVRPHQLAARQGVI